MIKLTLSLSGPQGGIRSPKASENYVRNNVEHSNPYDHIDYEMPDWTSPQKMVLKILPLNDVTRNYYSKEFKQHKNDAGLDLIFPEDVVVPARARG